MKLFTKTKIISKFNIKTVRQISTHYPIQDDLYDLSEDTKQVFKSLNYVILFNNKI